MGGSGFAVRRFGVWFGVRGSGLGSGFEVGPGVQGSRFGSWFEPDRLWWSDGTLSALHSGTMGAITSHEDLVAWQLSEQLKDRVFEITANGRCGAGSLLLRRHPARGALAPANLAEGFYRFRPRDTARFVRIAIGSLGETINHLGHARKQHFISDAEADELVTLAKRAKGASSAWLAYLLTCPPDGPVKRSH